MNKVALFLLVVIFPHVQFGQSAKELDSLLSKLSSVDSLSKERVDLSNKLASYHTFRDSSRSIEYYRDSKRIAQKIGYREGKVDALLIIATNYRIRGKYERALFNFRSAELLSDSIGYLKGQAGAIQGQGLIRLAEGDFQTAIDSFEKAIELNRSISDEGNLAHNYDNLARALSRVGRMKESLDYHYLSLKEYYNLKDKMGMMNTHLNIGVAHYKQKEYDNALANYQKSLRLSSLLAHEIGKAVVQNNIALVFEERDQYDSAEYYYGKSIQLGEQLNYVRVLGWSYNGVGKLEQKKGNYLQAEVWLSKALQIREKRGHAEELASTYLTIGDNRYSRNKFQDALNFYDKAIEISNQLNEAPIYRDCLIGKAKTYFAMKDFDKAIEFQNEYISMNDSLITDNQFKKIAIREAEYQFKLEQDSISFVQESDRVRLNAEIDQQKLSQFILMISVIFVTIVLGLVYYSYTSLKKANRRLHILNEKTTVQRDELRKINGLKARLFTIISHDLRSPLNQLYSFAFLMKRHVELNHDHSLEDVFDEFDYSYYNVTQLMDNVLNWGLIDSDAGKLVFQSIRLDKEVQKCIEVYKPYATSKEIKMDYTSDHEDLEIEGDLSSIQIVVRNIINNAIKFTPKNGTITIRLYAVDTTYVRLSIEDRGIGISDESLSTIFELDEGKIRLGTDGEKGTGLGLKLVHDFVKMNKGEIDVHSEEGVGTIFTLTFKVKKYSEPLAVNES